MCTNQFLTRLVVAVGLLAVASAAGAFPTAHLDQTNITPTTFPPFFQYQSIDLITDFTGTWPSIAQSVTAGKTGDWYGFTIAGEGPHHPPINNVLAPPHAIEWKIWNVDNSGNLTSVVPGQTGTMTIQNWDFETTFDVSLNGSGIPVVPGDRYAIALEDLTTTPNYPNFGPVGTASWYYGDWNQQDNYAAGQGYRFDLNTNMYQPLNFNGSIDNLFSTYVTPEPSSAAILMTGLIACGLSLSRTRRGRRSLRSSS